MVLLCTPHQDLIAIVTAVIPPALALMSSVIVTIQEMLTTANLFANHVDERCHVMTQFVGAIAVTTVSPNLYQTAAILLLKHLCINIVIVQNVKACVVSLGEGKVTEVS